MKMRVGRLWIEYCGCTSLIYAATAATVIVRLNSCEISSIHFGPSPAKFTMIAKTMLIKAPAEQDVTNVVLVRQPSIRL